MSHHAPSGVSAISTELDSVGIVAIAAYYLGLSYLKDTYFVWPVREYGREYLVVRWEMHDDFHEEIILLDNLILTIDQLATVRARLS